MIARSDDVYLLMFEDIKGVMTFRVGGIIKTITFYSITGVYNEKITAIFVCFLAKMVSEGDVVTPICGVLWPVLPCQTTSGPWKR